MHKTIKTYDMNPASLKSSAIANWMNSGQFKFNYYEYLCIRMDIQNITFYCPDLKKDVTIHELRENCRWLGKEKGSDGKNRFTVTYIYKKIMAK